jgi:hypothetical protein
MTTIWELRQRAAFTLGTMVDEYIDAHDQRGRVFLVSGLAAGRYYTVPVIVGDGLSAGYWQRFVPACRQFWYAVQPQHRGEATALRMARGRAAARPLVSALKSLDLGDEEQEVIQAWMAEMVTVNS